MSAKPIPCANDCEAAAFEIVIKNLQGEIERLKASQRTKQEIKDDGHCQACDGALCTAKKECVALSNPPQRTWAGLTDKAITKVVDSMPRGIKGWMSDWDLYEYARAIEAKLKEKNNA